MIRIEVNELGVITEADGKRIEVLSELCMGVIEFINDMTQDKPEAKPKVVDMFISGIKAFV